MSEKNILIVDDDEDLSFIISEMLEGYGYSVTTAASGEEAFDLLSQHTYHLILLDINVVSFARYRRYLLFLQALAPAKVTALQALTSAVTTICQSPTL